MGYAAVQRADAASPIPALPPGVHPVDFMAPWVMGGMLSSLLQGVLFVQFNSYFDRYKRDSIHTRAFVGLVSALNMLKTIQTFAIVWDQTVTKFGNFDELAIGPWYQITESLMAAAIGFAVQCYFCLRVSRLTKQNLFVMLPLVGCMLLGFAGATALTIISFEMGSNASFIARFNTTVTIMLCGTMAADCIITATLLYQLLTSRTGFNTTDTLISRIVHVVWTSATPPFLAAMLNLILYVTMSSKNSWFITFNMILNYLYSISMMYTINSRTSLKRGIIHTSEDEAASTHPTSATFALRTRGGARINRVEISKHTVVERSDTPDMLRGDAHEHQETSDPDSSISKVRRMSTDSDDTRDAKRPTAL